MKPSLEIFDWPEKEPLQIAYRLTNNRAEFDSIRIDGKPIPLSLFHPSIVRTARWIVEDISISLNPNTKHNKQ